MLGLKATTYQPLILSYDYRVMQTFGMNGLEYISISIIGKKSSAFGTEMFAYDGAAAPS